MRSWNLSAFFPEVKPAHTAQRGEVVEASSLPCAARRGIEVMLASEALKGKRITIAKVTIVAVGKTLKVKRGV